MWIVARLWYCDVSNHLKHCSYHSLPFWVACLSLCWLLWCQWHSISPAMKACLHCRLLGVACRNTQTGFKSSNIKHCKLHQGANLQCFGQAWEACRTVPRHIISSISYPDSRADHITYSLYIYITKQKSLCEFLQDSRKVQRTSTPCNKLLLHPLRWKAASTRFPFYLYINKRAWICRHELYWGRSAL